MLRSSRDFRPTVAFVSCCRGFLHLRPCIQLYDLSSTATAVKIIQGATRYRFNLIQLTGLYNSTSCMRILGRGDVPIEHLSIMQALRNTQAMLLPAFILTHSVKTLCVEFDEGVSQLPCFSQCTGLLSLTVRHFRGDSLSSLKSLKGLLHLCVCYCENVTDLVNVSNSLPLLRALDALYCGDAVTSLLIDPDVPLNSDIDVSIAV